jgi:hypothetical protein
MKKIILLLLFVPLITNAQFKDIIKLGKEKVTTITNPKENGIDINAGLKEALNKGITKQVSKLTAVDGFYKNELVKILLPSELQKVDQTLRKIGMADLADKGLKVLNRAAEDAVKEATPLFVDAVKKITISDAKNILMGNEDAATTYLQNNTSTALYSKFSPVIETSLNKVGADAIWTKIIKQYNSIPLVSKVNPDLKDYVTQQTMKGVFKMIGVEEKEIRTNITARSSNTLKKVFALQDKKS